MSSEQLKQAQITQLRARLITQQQELTKSLHEADATTKPVTLDQQSVGRVSRIDAIQQQQMAIANQQQTNGLLKGVELALRRIDDASYGDCLECGEPIAYARLQAQPSASLCIACQSARETN
ncbi:TraR/DksA family transcriptional regulator [Gammaproteobacteria bacterium]|nr:TraR/DksA family transcriptional regulator [Gammaproteobacteria bacterium]